MGWTDWDVWPWNWGEPPPETPVLPSAEIRGRVELICGVPLAHEKVRIENAPIGATTDDDGNFHVRGIPPGGWTLFVTHHVAETAETFTKRFESFAVSGVSTTTPTAVLSRPLAIAGRVGNIGASNYLDYYVTVPALSLVTLLSPTGTFVLRGLPPGRSRVVLNSFVERPDPPLEGARVNPLFGRAFIDVDVRTGPVQVFDGLEAPAL